MNNHAYINDMNNSKNMIKKVIEEEIEVYI